MLLLSTSTEPVASTTASSTITTIIGEQLATPPTSDTEEEDDYSVNYPVRRSHSSLQLTAINGRNVESVRLFTNEHLDVEYNRQFFQQFLVQRGFVCLQLASKSEPGRVVAVISGRLSMDRAFGSQLNGHIYTLAVDRKYRRNGLGARLISEIEQEMAYIAGCVNCSLKSLTLEVKQNDPTARAFYLRQGFEETGFEKDYYPRQGGNCIKMTKFIY